MNQKFLPLEAELKGYPPVVMIPVPNICQNGHPLASENCGHLTSVVEMQVPGIFGLLLSFLRLKLCLTHLLTLPCDLQGFLLGDSFVVFCWPFLGDSVRQDLGSAALTAIQN